MLKILPLFLIAIVLSVFLSYAPTKPTTIAQADTQTDFNIDEVINSNGEFDYSTNEAIFNNEQVNYPKKDLADASNNISDKSVLGATTNSNGEEKWIEVDIAKQQTTAWEGNRIVRQFSVSTGRWAPTPKGTFYIWLKTRSQSMKGGSVAKGDYYNLPNVPHNMFFSGPVALHGAYWHNNFGHPMSHGCVNEPLAQAAWMFDWAGPVAPAGQNAIKATPENPGTRVWVH